MKRTGPTDLTAAAWHGSRHSSTSDGDCLEVADGVPGVVPVRDSPVPDGFALVLPAGGRSAFVTALTTTGRRS